MHKKIKSNTDIHWFWICFRIGDPASAAVTDVVTTDAGLSVSFITDKAGSDLDGFNNESCHEELNYLSVE